MSPQEQTQLEKVRQYCTASTIFFVCIVAVLTYFVVKHKLVPSTSEQPASAVRAIPASHHGK